MKYNDLAKQLRKIGCFDTGEQANGHPLWFSPVTGRVFKMSNHGAKEVPKGTLGQIKRDAGLE